jgi:hypothetical protein
VNAKLVRSCTLLASACLVVGIPITPAALFGQESSPAQTLSVMSEADGSDVAEAVHDPDLPDSPGTVQSQNATGNSSASGQQSSAQTPATQPAQAQPPQSQPLQSPVGTAAARTANPSGIAASEPAGAAIAPAKQRRVRTILISVAAVVGTAAAVGVVAGLSAASPSRPPGAR